MKTILEYVINQKIKQNPNLELYEEIADRGEPKMIYAKVTNIETVKRLAQSDKYRNSDDIAISLEDMIKKYIVLLRPMYMRTFNKQLTIGFCYVTEDDLKDNYTKIKSINENEFNIDYWNKNNWNIYAR